MTARLVRRILVVDDERDQRRKYADLVLHGREEHPDHLIERPIYAEVTVAQSVKEALTTLLDARTRGAAFDVLVTDLFMQPLDGLDLIDSLRPHGFLPDSLQVVLLSAKEDAAECAERIADARRQWLQEAESGFSVVLRAEVAGAAAGGMEDHDQAFLAEIWKQVWTSLDSPAPEDLPAADQDWREVFKTADEGLAQEIAKLLGTFAPTPANVLICGPSGTGKTLLGSLVHRFSGRSGELQICNLGATPAALFDSTLFGHEAGAFPGAVARRLGILERAGGGTIIIEEISELSGEQQLKLASVLDRMEAGRVGSGEIIRFSFRVVATTCKDLEQEMRQGRFREDLFYRVQGYRIDLPPLSARRQDIGLLARTFWQQADGVFPARSEAWEESALECLAGLEWEGNAIELRNFIRRLKVQHPPGTPVTVEALELGGRSSPDRIGPSGGRDFDVFLSYAQADQEQAVRLLERLRTAGLAVFFADETVLPGARWMSEVRQALAASSEVWVLASPSSLKSDWVRFEVDVARYLDKTIAPVLYRCQPSDLPAFLREAQVVDLHEVQRLIDTCKKRQAARQQAMAAAEPGGELFRPLPV